MLLLVIIFVVMVIIMLLSFFIIYKLSTLNKTFHIQVCVFFYSIIINICNHPIICIGWMYSIVYLLL